MVCEKKDNIIKSSKLTNPLRINFVINIYILFYVSFLNDILTIVTGGEGRVITTKSIATTSS